VRDPVQGVLEDEREQEVSHRQPKRVFQARAGRRSRMSCGAEVATRGVLPSYTYSNWTEQLFCSTSINVMANWFTILLDNHRNDAHIDHDA